MKIFVAGTTDNRLAGKRRNAQIYRFNSAHRTGARGISPAEKQAFFAQAVKRGRDNRLAGIAVLGEKFGTHAFHQNDDDIVLLLGTGRTDMTFDALAGFGKNNAAAAQLILQNPQVLRLVVHDIEIFIGELVFQKCAEQAVSAFFGQLVVIAVGRYLQAADVNIVIGQQADKGVNRG